MTRLFPVGAKLGLELGIKGVKHKDPIRFLLLVLGNIVKITQSASFWIGMIIYGEFAIDLILLCF